VPGAVAGWAALAERYGRLGLDACLADAIDAAERGFAVTARCAVNWQAKGDRWPGELGRIPRLGDVVRMPLLGATLRAIADHGPSALYEGRVAEAIASASWLEADDLAAFRPRWVEPLSVPYRGHEVLELPAPTQGVAALQMLGLLERSTPGLATRVRCAQLGLEDALAHVRDGADVSGLIDPAYLDRRSRLLPGAVREPAGGTVYLCAVDGDRMAVSFIQSLYDGFGSGVHAPGTGVILQNRGAGFSLQGAVAPGKRPYHTIMPALLLRDGDLLGALGVVGGFIQAQAHMQLVSAMVDDGLDPQAALDRPRFRVDGKLVRLEEGLWGELDTLRDLDLDLEPVRDEDTFGFGSGQIILADGDALVGGSDQRKDGYAAGF
jgi:gamma-glutamyltranspeptidase/glutathione hydrolase